MTVPDNNQWLAWHYARRALPGYTELTLAHEAVNWAMASAEIEPDTDLARFQVQAAMERWVSAYAYWIECGAVERMPTP